MMFRKTPKFRILFVVCIKFYYHTSFVSSQGVALEWSCRLSPIQISIDDKWLQACFGSPDWKSPGIEVATRKVHPRCNHADQSSNGRHQRLSQRFSSGLGSFWRWGVSREGKLRFLSTRWMYPSVSYVTVYQIGFQKLLQKIISMQLNARVNVVSKWTHNF